MPLASTPMTSMVTKLPPPNGKPTKRSRRNKRSMTPATTRAPMHIFFSITQPRDAGMKESVRRWKANPWRITGHVWIAGCDIVTSPGRPAINAAEECDARTPTTTHAAQHRHNRHGRRACLGTRRRFCYRTLVHCPRDPMMPAAPLSQVAVRLRPQDNVAVAARSLPAGTELTIDDRHVALERRVGMGHK